MLMTKKELYTSPEVDVFTVRTEGVICTSPLWGNPNNPGGNLFEDPGFTFDF